MIVLVLEIATIVALHAIKINHGKMLNAKDMTKNMVNGQQEPSVKNQRFYSFAGL